MKMLTTVAWGRVEDIHNATPLLTSVKVLIGLTRKRQLLKRFRQKKFSSTSPQSPPPGVLLLNFLLL